MPRFRSSSRPARPVSWYGVGRGNLTLSGNDVESTPIVEITETDLLSNPTIVRIRGNIDVAAPLMGVDLSQTSVYLTAGIYVGDDQIGTWPNPTDAEGADRPWLWLRTAYITVGGVISQTFTSAGAVNTVYNGYQHYENSVRSWDIDIKAMRRLPRGHSLRVVWKKEVAGTDGDLHINYLLRALIKE